MELSFVKSLASLWDCRDALHPAWFHASLCLLRSLGGRDPFAGICSAECTLCHAMPCNAQCFVFCLLEQENTPRRMQIQWKLLCLPFLQLSGNTVGDTTRAYELKQKE